ncbi:MAG: bifunctional precorrin-2 dehydrogenase/sirohydrochlorin ferrochelatase [Thermodesulfobacteriota bacterium]|nr:bifunctional precorrin-2 dehydrogenase/sirohydrochlorin ferrochelatase [Thermodesulfobacteriota bacterium]
MKYYPINVDITDKICVVLGGGRIAQRKVESLLKYKGAVTVISPSLTPKLKELQSLGKIKNVCREYQSGDIKDAFVVFCATNDSNINKKAAEEAKKRGILFNVVDMPKMCNFIVPSVVQRGDLFISISTNGKSPALAKRIRKELEAAYGEEYALFLILMGAIREKLLLESSDSQKNSMTFYRLIDSDILDYVKKGKEEEVNRVLFDVLGEGYTLQELNIVF